MDLRVSETSPQDKDLVGFFVELNRPNPQAWEGVARGAWAQASQDDRGEPIRTALGLWLRTQGNPQELKDQLCKLSPCHGYWLEHAETTPLGFARLVVEESRRKILVGSAGWQESCRRALSYLEWNALAEVAERREIQDLQALSAAYLADGLRHRRAEPVFAVEAGKAQATACEQRHDDSWARRFLVRAEPIWRAAGELDPVSKRRLSGSRAD